MANVIIDAGVKTGADELIDVIAEVVPGELRGDLKVGRPVMITLTLDPATGQLTIAPGAGAGVLSLARQQPLAVAGVAALGALVGGVIGRRTKRCGF